MPHTSHKKKHARIKRQEIVGDDGWTRVMSNKPLSVTGALPSLDHQQPVEEAPEGLTESDVLARYIDIEKRWKASESWKTVEDTLKTRVIASDTRIDACVLYGSGTFTGLAQGWINRTHVAMYQLAAFKAVVDLIRKLSPASRPQYLHD